jgi:hypothetical protein
MTPFKLYIAGDSPEDFCVEDVEADLQDVLAGEADVTHDDDDDEWTGPSVTVEGDFAFEVVPTFDTIVANPMEHVERLLPHYVTVEQDGVEVNWSRTAVDQTGHVEWYAG